MNRWVFALFITPWVIAVAPTSGRAQTDPDAGVPAPEDSDWDESNTDHQGQDPYDDLIFSSPTTLDHGQLALPNRQAPCQPKKLKTL